jgi:hypothetical protein
VKFSFSVLRLIKGGEDIGLRTITCERKAKRATKGDSTVRTLGIFCFSLLGWVIVVGREV